VQIRASYFRFSLRSPHALSLITPHHKGYFSSPVGQEDSCPVGQGRFPLVQDNCSPEAAHFTWVLLEERKRSEGDKGGVDGIYLVLDYICLSDFYLHAS